MAQTALSDILLPMAPRKQPGDSLDDVLGCSEAPEPGQAAGEG